MIKGVSPVRPSRGMSRLFGSTGTTGTTEGWTGLDRFAVELYHAIRDGRGNRVFSPASVALSLAMVHAGARGETAREIADALHLGTDPAGAHAWIGALLRGWRDLDGVELLAANRLFRDVRLPFDDRFLETVAEVFDAPLATMNFGGDPDGARAEINDWVEGATGGKIRNLLPPSAVTARTRLALANAVYFKARWAHEFDERRTTKQTFHRPWKRKAVPMMPLQAEFAYAEHPGDRLRVLDLPYRGGPFVMTIVLPDERDGLPAVEERLTADAIARWTGAMAHEDVWVALPRFRTETDEPLRLSEPLGRLGVRRVFDPDRADLGGMAPAVTRLWVGSGFHGARLEVDEQGTEAAAATFVGLTLGLSARPEPEPRSFVADHPFLYLVRDTDRGAILFMGRVEDP